MKREDTIGFTVRSLSNLFRRCLDAEIDSAKEPCLTGLQGWIIGYIHDHSDVPVYQGQLENVFEVRRSTMTEILNAMEKNGLIIRVRDEHDARKKRLLLTERAEQFHSRVVASISDIEHLAGENLTSDEIKRFCATAAKIKLNLENTLKRKGEQEHG